MSRAVNAVVVGLAAFILLAGVTWYWAVASQPDKISPEVRWGTPRIEGNETVIPLQVAFTNRLDAELQFDLLDVKFRINGEVLASNTTEAARGERMEVLPARGQLVKDVELRLPNDFVSTWFASHVKRGEKSEAFLDGRAVFLVGQDEEEVLVRDKKTWETTLRQSLEDHGGCGDDVRGACLASVESRWEEENRTLVLSTRLMVANPSEDELKIDHPVAELSFGGIVVAKAEAEGQVVSPKDEDPLTFRLLMDHEAFTRWWSGFLADQCRPSATALDVAFHAEFNPTNRTPSQPSNTTTPSPPPNSTSPSPTPTTSPSPTTTSPSPTGNNSTGYAYARFDAQAEDDGEVRWKLEMSALHARIGCDSP